MCCYTSSSLLYWFSNWHRFQLPYFVKSLREKKKGTHIQVFLFDLQHTSSSDGLWRHTVFWNVDIFLFSVMVIELFLMETIQPLSASARTRNNSPINYWLPTNLKNDPSSFWQLTTQIAHKVQLESSLRNRLIHIQRFAMFWIGWIEILHCIAKPY